ncbi:MAG: hypothetical protein NDJ94_16585 [Vicinamibacteria bacterium]|nr:hypothetical protein [Vicinamibacteria bacterium]
MPGDAGAGALHSGRSAVARIWLGLALVVGVALLANLVFLLAVPRTLPPGWRQWLPGFDVMALAVETDGDGLWAGGRDGLVLLDRTSGRELRRLNLPYVRALARGADGTLWIGHQGGLSRLRGATGAPEAVRPAGVEWAAAGRVNALHLDADGLLIGTDGGLWRHRAGDTFEPVPVAGLLSPMVNVIAKDARGGLWLGSAVPPAGGLTIVQPEGTATFDVARGLPHASITAITFLDEANALVGTGFYQRGGAARFELTPAGWRLAATLSVADGLAGPKVRSIHLDRRSVLWVGSEYDGVAYRRVPAPGGARRRSHGGSVANGAPPPPTPRGVGLDGGWRRLRREDGLSDGEVKCFAEDAAGALFLGTLRGLSVLDAAARAALP